MPLGLRALPFGLLPGEFLRLLLRLGSLPRFLDGAQLLGFELRLAGALIGGARLADRPGALIGLLRRGDGRLSVPLAAAGRRCAK